jgi:hypothetical protein
MLIRDFDQVTASWVEGCLRNSGALVQGDVAGIDVQPSTADNSRNAKIAVRYTPAATGALPGRLFLKLCSGNGVFGPSEVHLYTRDYVGLADAPLLRCFDAQYEEAPRGYHLLLEDVSDTHSNNWQRTPALPHGLALAEALAKLHAHRWGEGRFVPLGYSVPSAAFIERYVAQSRPGLQVLFRVLGDELPPAWREALQRFFDEHPRRMIERTRDLRGFTVVHGDDNPGNVLSPRAGGETPLYLIDRQPFDWSLATWLGVSDVSYAIAHWWPVETRRACERAMMQRYFDTLLQRGVTDYAFTQVQQDYRLSIGLSLCVAVGWCAQLADPLPMKWLWWGQLQKAMPAYFDWDGEAMLR